MAGLIRAIHGLQQQKHGAQTREASSEGARGDARVKRGHDAAEISRAADWGGQSSYPAQRLWAPLAKANGAERDRRLAEIAAIRTLCGFLSTDIPAAISVVINMSARENDFFAEVFDENDHFLSAVDGQKLERDARKRSEGGAIGGTAGTRAQLARLSDMYPPIDRVQAARHLRLATRHVFEGRERIAKQRELAARLERHGHDIRSASALLTQFEEILILQEENLDRIKKEVGDRE